MVFSESTHQLAVCPRFSKASFYFANDFNSCSESGLENQKYMAVNSIKICYCHKNWTLSVFKPTFLIFMVFREKHCSGSSLYQIRVWLCSCTGE